MDYDYSPTALKKVVYAGTQAASFPRGSRDLKELAELNVSPERVRRATERVGADRVAERDAQVAAYEELPIPARLIVPADQPVPAVACVQMDGGRLQYFDRAEPQRNEDDTFWREMKVGCLWSMTSEVSAEDPCPQLPASFVDPERMRRMVREIKGFSGPDGDAEDEAEEPRIDDRPGRPQPLARSVVASRHSVETFGKLLASEAHHRNFQGAPRKAFVADGSESNWGVWHRHFSHYVPILDFIHALTYIYAAAMAGRALKEGWQAYRAWAQWIWSGQVNRVIAALELRQQELGKPAPDTPQTAPSAIVAKSLVYLRNQQSRMDYPEYRKQGLPMTSTYVESTVKQINRRMKGTEKFWSHGVESMLTLVADHLSDTPTLAHFWRNRPHRLTGSRCHQSTAA
ncbi:MAG: hypothetical protein EHM48_07565 [Planctomycetaceae bacterium]|nr:MAG: hypothetical protein EHM48_07565 [Planctomycetaceae bacterium]